MPQKLLPQTDTPVGSLQESGHFHQDKILFPVPDRAQDGFHGGKGVLRNLWPCPRTAGHQRRLARIGPGEKAHIRQEFQLKEQHHPLALLSFLRQDWFLVRSRNEPGVPATPFAPHCYQVGRGIYDILQELTSAASRPLPDFCSQGDRNNLLSAVLPTLIFTLAVTTGVYVKRAVKLEVEQRVQRWIPANVGAAPIPTVATIRAALGLVLGPQKAGASTATIAGVNIQPDRINHRKLSNSNNPNCVDSGENWWSSNDGWVLRGIF